LSTDHQRIEELLAGYALDGLSDDEAAEADRLLSDHVPGCALCRETVAGFRSVTADLALAAGSVRPPDTLLPRLHREFDAHGRRRSPAQLLAVAAGVVAVVGLAGIAMSQEVRASHSRARVADMRAALDALSQPGARITQIGPTREFAAPGSPVVYLYGAGVPTPPPGREYRIWLLAPDGSALFLGALAIEDGVAFARVSVDPSMATRMLITVEPANSAPASPGEVAWRPAA
jgi:hypothetical protein